MDNKNEIKPIRPTIAEFESTNEFKEFLDYASNTKKTDSIGMNKLRELYKRHLESNSKS
ncbi:hypothetical protein D3C73_185170 [compost metagenome]